MTRFEDIRSFVERRFSKDSHWLDGNCFWFMHILKTRFPDVEECYDEIAGHFFVRTKDGICVDWSGVYEPLCVSLVRDIKRYDPVLWSRLVRDCVD